MIAGILSKPHPFEDGAFFCFMLIRPKFRGTEGLTLKLESELGDSQSAAPR